MPLSTELWPIDGARAVVFNTEAAWFYLKSEEYRADVHGATHIYCDGAGLAAYARRRFGREVSRLHGPDIMFDYLQSAVGRKVMLFGGSEAAQVGLRLAFPDFFERNTVVSDTRMLAADDFPVVAAEIAEQKHDDVLIFLGLLRQERFQALLHAAGYRGASIGLGAAIDFLSGTKTRSGKAWQILGLEWLPRMVREPRMLPRVARSFALFPRWYHPQNRQLEAFLFGETQSSLER